MNRRKRTIKWKLFLYLIGFTAFLLFLVWFFQIAHLNTFYMNIKKDELTKVAEKVTDNVKSSDDVQSYIDEIAERYDISINLTDSTGKSLYNSNINVMSFIYIVNNEQFEIMYDKAESNGGSIMYEVVGRYRDISEFKQPQDLEISPYTGNGSQLQSFDDNRGMMPEPDNKDRYQQPESNDTNAKSMIYVEIIDNNGEEQVLMISSLITPVDATVSTLRRQFIYISIIFVALAVCVAFIISKIISKPIVRINESAKHLADGRFDIKFNGEGFREVQELSQTLNYAAQELGKSEQLQKDLIANVSHDLRTPLTMITAYSEVMRDIPGENNPENVQVIIDEAKRLTTLVNDLLDLSKLQAGVNELKIEEFDFTDSIIKVMNRFSKLTEQDGYSINFEYRDRIRIKADEYKIYQVVYNLINNAINYAGEDKTVIVRQIVRGDIVRLEVEDHGKGIAEEELKNIWDRYYKVDKTHIRAVQGSGLGLSIVQNILKMHDARFGVQSSVGNGSVFWFELKMESN